MTDPIHHEPERETPQPRRVGPSFNPFSDSRRKSPILALILSGMPGVGQIYVGYYQRGFVHAIVAASIIALLNSNGFENNPLFPLFAVFLAFFWLYNMIDAARRATLYNHALAGDSEIPLPDDITLPTFHGSIAGGITIAAVGLILLLNTRFGVSLGWVEDWWPAAILLFGAYLVWKKGIRERKAQQATQASHTDDRPRGAPVGRPPTRPHTLSHHNHPPGPPPAGAHPVGAGPVPPDPSLQSYPLRLPAPNLYPTPSKPTP
ncbi:MAG: hypothetical protein R2991_01015 [Thermoanaerobaculia bacterium]